MSQKELKRCTSTLPHVLILKVNVPDSLELSLLLGS